MLRRLQRLLLLILVTGWTPALCFACIWGFGASYEESIKESDITIEAIVNAPPREIESQFATSFHYPVTVKTFERGKAGSKIEEIVWERGKVRHERDGTVDCPRWWGSGIEQSLKPGVSYRLFLKSTTYRKGAPELIWAEVLKH